MVQQKEPSVLSKWVDLKQSQGKYFFTSEETYRELKISEAAFRKSVSRLAIKNRIVRVHNDFYIVVPLEYAARGVLPPEWFIDDLMRYLEQPYYVGLLSAASLYGAAHQQPQQYQVVTVRSLREARLKDLAIRFFVKKKVSATSVQRIKVQTGYITVSSPEATAIDLVRYARAIGGLDTVFSVLQELGERLEPEKLVEGVQQDGNIANAQRLGWLLDEAGFSKITGPLGNWIAEKKPFPAKLEASLSVKGAKTDSRWRVIVNTTVEGES
ncbi:MAG: type IV toxin-antitoxin system AbiEi family antitoxin [Syntrophorhabdaceae bacterium]|nr:type IV toxin-antitoxin system AbiEi family antitoxin [Syntrophorhabdaceae bacterium]MDD5243246.1 type IV toxin-antitoxin system AbiEi family antitoxin [Syntrophorhabdaceae bacterium]